MVRRDYYNGADLVRLFGRLVPYLFSVFRILAHKVKECPGFKDNRIKVIESYTKLPALSSRSAPTSLPYEGGNKKKAYRSILYDCENKNDVFGGILTSVEVHTPRQMNTLPKPSPVGNPKTPVEV
eukprot:1190757-Prorocentrum_minimum.AAC.2